MLSAEDDTKLQQMISVYCTVISKAVARLYKGENGKWTKISAGVATLEVHKTNNRMHIGLYNLTTQLKTFDMGLFLEMRYADSGHNFHSFFGMDGLPYGLSFSGDARNFFTSVISALNTRPQSTFAKWGNAGAKLFGSFKRGKKGKLDFGRKSNKENDVTITLKSYEHTKHIGFSADRGFEVSAENESLALELLEALQIKVNSEQEMADVMTVIDKFGADQLREALDSRNANKSEGQARRTAPRRPPPQAEAPKVPLPPTSRPVVPQRHPHGAHAAFAQPGPPPPPPPPISQAPTPKDGRQSLLDSITNFDPSRLSRVDSNEQKQSAPNILDSLGSALMDMLNQRRAHLSDSEEDGEDFDS
ncbi:hypothetical protein Aperf_G00000035119 [Anoplocephala perfoliata]